MTSKKTSDIYTHRYITDIYIIYVYIIIYVCVCACVRSKMTHSESEIVKSEEPGELYNMCPQVIDTIAQSSKQSWDVL